VVRRARELYAQTACPARKITVMKPAHVLVVVVAALLVSVVFAVFASIRVPVSTNQLEIDTPAPVLGRRG
jgi:hypothetical protein